MATFNGTQIDDIISGTNDDDIITGLAGDDVVNGAGGNDTITGGEGADDLLGGAGDDTFIVESADDLINLGSDDALGDDGVAPDDDVDTFDDIKGGDGTDTLVTELRGGDEITNNGSAGTIWGVAGVLTNNLELVQVTNASDIVLELGTDSVFAFDQTLESTDFGSDDAPLVAATFTSNVVGEGGVTFDETAGIIIDGVTYEDGDTFTTVSGGEVEVNFASKAAIKSPAFATVRDSETEVRLVSKMEGHWLLDYSGPAVDGLAVITAESTTEEQTLAVTATDDAGNEIDITVTLNNTFGADVDLDTEGATANTKVIGSDNGNDLYSGAGDDTLIGNGGYDYFYLYDGNNKVWAGATDDDGDSAYIYGDGNNTVGLGVGDDYIEVNGAGDNTLYGGEGEDDFYFYAASGSYTGAEGSNTAWGGADDDVFEIYGDGTNVLGGGAGADEFDIYDDSSNVVYLGADDDDDDIQIWGDGDNTVFGGVGADGDGSNDIEIRGDGDNTVFNGNGEDSVYVTGEGNNLLWGGAGNDTFEFNGGSGTVAFAAGNGVDTIEGFVFDGTTKIDVTELGFADVDDVLASMSDAGDLDGDTFNDVLLFVEPGQGVIFSDMSLTDFQLAAPADWLVV